LPDRCCPTAAARPLLPDRYFGGMARCEAANNGPDEEEEERADGADGNKRSDLVCGSCSSGVGDQECKEHGKDFIEYKCKFCCTVSAWYCWGNTHFCHTCHRKQMKGDYITRKPLSDLPQCTGGPKCKLGVDTHPPNGSEFSLGCALCRGKNIGY
jgi:hypothetical protein